MALATGSSSLYFRLSYAAYFSNFLDKSVSLLALLILVPGVTVLPILLRLFQLFTEFSVFLIQPLHALLKTIFVYLKFYNFLLRFFPVELEMIQQVCVATQTPLKEKKKGIENNVHSSIH